jgi:hypothetical protein
LKRIVFPAFTVLCLVFSLSAHASRARQLYIIGFKENVDVGVAAATLASEYDGTVEHVWNAVRSCALTISPASARRIGQLSTVDYVEADDVLPEPDIRARGPVSRTIASQESILRTDAPSPVPPVREKTRIGADAASPCPAAQTRGGGANGKVGWGLDRIDSRFGLDGAYHYGLDRGRYVNIYVFGTGIRASHTDFAKGTGGTRVGQGYIAYDDGHGMDDCDGFGTRVASIAAGNQAGVARGANIVPVKIASCSTTPGSLSGTVANYIDGINWLTQQRTSNKLSAAVAILGVWYSRDDAGLKAAARALVATGAFVVAPGGHETCCVESPVNAYFNSMNSSPGNATGVYTVAASTNMDMNWTNTYLGSNIAMFAPGHQVDGAGINYDYEYNNSPGWSGSPYAAALVGGTAALAYEMYGYGYNASNGQYTPTGVQIGQALTNAATSGRLRINSPNTANNLLLYTREFEDNGTVSCDGSVPVR